MALKTAKNLISSRSEHNTYYSKMRGVDFTSDPSFVDDRRFAYLVNMYKNYRSENGDAIETIPGYRKIGYKTDIVFRNVYGLHLLKNDKVGTIIFIHIYRSNFQESSLVAYVESKDKRKTVISSMAKAESRSFTIGDTLYVLDGESIYSISVNVSNNGDRDDDYTYNVTNLYDDPYIPTTYINMPPLGWQPDENNSYGAEYEQRNLLTSKFKVTFISDGENKEFRLPEQNLDEVISVSAGSAMYEPTQYTYDAENGIITLIDTIVPPDKDTVITVVASKKIGNLKGAALPQGKDASLFILGCTIATLFDDRVFLSGNPMCPNHIFWCGFDASTGIVEPSYWGILDNMYDGIDQSRITGMMAVSDTLCVLKSESNEGAMYFHTPYSTGEDLMPKTYPRTRGVNTVGCLGACVNFLDDPVFVSRLGLEGIERLSAGAERSVGHRSSNVDAVLLKCDLTKAQLAEWDGYLLLLADGQLFMADSRQKFTHSTGSVQYEWYYVDTVGCWISTTDNPIHENYHYATFVPSYLQGLTEPSLSVKESALGGVCPLDITVNSFKHNSETYYYVEEDGKNYLCFSYGDKTGGEFMPAKKMICANDTVYFACDGGELLAFNFDKMNKDGTLDPQYYAFDNRAIVCGCAFKSDNCGIPHLTKSTVKRSTVVKTKNMRRSTAKVRVRTNKTPYHLTDGFSSVTFDFNDVYFSDFAFLDGEKDIFVINEKEKKWVEKQYYIYSDDYQRPFGLYSLAFRYQIIGRYKEK